MKEIKYKLHPYWHQITKSIWKDKHHQMRNNSLTKNKCQKHMTFHHIPSKNKIKQKKNRKSWSANHHLLKHPWHQSSLLIINFQYHLLKINLTIIVSWTQLNTIPFFNVFDSFTQCKMIFYFTFIYTCMYIYIGLVRITSHTVLPRQKVVCLDVKDVQWPLNTYFYLFKNVNLKYSSLSCILEIVCRSLKKLSFSLICIKVCNI